MKNEVYADFTIADFDEMTHDEITQKPGLSPTKIYVKGPKGVPMPLVPLWLDEIVG